MPFPNTKTPNMFYDYWAPLLSNIQLRVMLVIFRKTLGWHKEVDQISLSQFMELTGFKQTAIRSALKKLVDMGLIFCSPCVNQANFYSLNPEKFREEKCVQANPPPSRRRTPPLRAGEPTKETNTKEINNTTTHKKEEPKPPPKSSSFSSRNLKELEQLNFSKEQNLKFYRSFTDEQILQAIDYVLSMKSPRLNLAASIWDACKNGYVKQKTKQEIEKENQEQLSLAIQERKKKATALALGYDSISIKDNRIELKIGNSFTSIGFSDSKCIAYLESHIQELTSKKEDKQSNNVLWRDMFPDSIEKQLQEVILTPKSYVPEKSKNGWILRAS